MVIFCVSLSFSLLVSLLMAPKKRKSTLSQNPLCSGHHLLPLLILSLLMSGSVMLKLIRIFQRTFLDGAFIRNAKSFFWIFSILTFPLSVMVGVGSSFVTSQSLVSPWSCKRFSLICIDLITLYLILSLTFKVRAL